MVTIQWNKNPPFPFLPCPLDCFSARRLLSTQTETEVRWKFVTKCGQISKNSFRFYNLDFKNKHLSPILNHFIGPYHLILISMKSISNIFINI